jgi:hypothetical protein
MKALIVLPFLMLALGIVGVPCLAASATNAPTYTQWFTDHAISHDYATFVNEPNITCDGVANEIAWSLPDVYTYTIPLTSIVVPGSAEKIYSTMYMKYIWDNTSLYILARWNDTTLTMQDLALFCWNINCSNYSAFMFTQANGMETPNPGELVNSWEWAYNDEANESQGQLIDLTMNNTGFMPPDPSNVKFGMTYGTWNSSMNEFQLEMCRSLVTEGSGSLDCTFTPNVPIRFAVGICAGYTSQNHAISWTYDLNLTHDPQPDSYVPYKPPTNQIAGYIAALVALVAVACVAIVLKIEWSRQGA